MRVVRLSAGTAHYSSGMSIPSRDAAPRAAFWSTLDAEHKRATLLRAAGEVFAREGLDAPMPSVAAAAGAGVGSVYRQFPSKRELLPALGVERLAGGQGGAGGGGGGRAGARGALAGH